MRGCVSARLCETVGRGEVGARERGSAGASVCRNWVSWEGGGAREGGQKAVGCMGPAAGMRGFAGAWVCESASAWSQGSLLKWERRAWERGYLGARNPRCSFARNAGAWMRGSMCAAQCTGECGVQGPMAAWVRGCVCARARRAWEWGKLGAWARGRVGTAMRGWVGARVRGCGGVRGQGSAVAWLRGTWEQGHVGVRVRRSAGAGMLECEGVCLRGRAGRGYGRAWECRVTGMGALVGVVSQLHGCVGKRGCKCGEAWAKGSEGTGARRCTDAWRGSDGAGGCSCAEACAGGMCG